MRPSLAIPFHPGIQSIYWLQIKDEPGAPYSLKLPLASLTGVESLWWALVMSAKASAFTFLGLWDLGPLPHRAALPGSRLGSVFWIEIRSVLLEGKVLDEVSGLWGCLLATCVLSPHPSFSAPLEESYSPVGERGPLCH